MAKSSETTASSAPKDAPAQVEPPKDFELTVNEFCIRRSATDRRVELLGAFAADERRAGHLKDTSDAYTRRLADFTARPI